VRDPDGREAPTAVVTIAPQLAHVQATESGASFINTGQFQSCGPRPPEPQWSRCLATTVVPSSLDS
jgi:hypothetical protein